MPCAKKPAPAIPRAITRPTIHAPRMARIMPSGRCGSARISI
jgi:hypothetical protein